MGGIQYRQVRWSRTPESYQWSGRHMTTGRLLFVIHQQRPAGAGKANFRKENNLFQAGPHGEAIFVGSFPNIIEAKQRAEDLLPPHPDKPKDG